MKLILLVLVVISLLSCSLSKVTVISPMVISTAGATTKKMRIDEDGNLKIGNIQISNWPLSTVNCGGCSIQLDKDLFPQGPESVVIMFDHRQNVKLLIVDVKRQFKKVKGWAFTMHEPYKIKVCNDNQCAFLGVGDTGEIKGCSVYIPWLMRAPAQSGIADSASNNFQAVVSCR